MRVAKFRTLWLVVAAMRFLAAGAPIVPVAFLAGCEKGPFEEAGEKIDDTVDDAKDEIDRRN
jgi:hypothetical protein